QVEQRLRVAHAAVAPGPARLLPAIERARHHLGRMHQIVVQLRNVTRLESAGPMRLFELAAKTSLAGRDCRQREEAILEVTRQKRTIVQILRRSSLGVQESFHAADDRPAVREERAQQLDMRVERHQLGTFVDHTRIPSLNRTPMVPQRSPARQGAHSDCARPRYTRRKTKGDPKMPVSISRGAVSALGASLALAVASSVEAQLAAAPAFTAADLMKVPSRNWITNGGNIYNQRYSALTQINRDNVKDVKAVWRVSLDGSGTGPGYSHQAQALFYEGVLYVVT